MLANRQQSKLTAIFCGSLHSEGWLLTVQAICGKFHTVKLLHFICHVRDWVKFQSSTESTFLTVSE